MRFHLTLLLSAGLLITIAAFGQTKSQDSSKGKDYPIGRAATKTFTGTVVSADAKSGKLIIKSWDNSQQQFAVTSNTALTLRSTKSSFADLKPGDQVIVTADGDKAVSIALSTSDLKNGSGSGIPQSGSPQSMNRVAPGMAPGMPSDEAIKNKGVNPYGNAGPGAGMQSAIRQEEGLRTAPPPTVEASAQGGQAAGGQIPSGTAAAQTTSSAPAQASPLPPNSPSAGASEQTTEKVSGNVVSVDPNANLITLKTAEGHLRVFVTDFNTKYSLTSAAGTMADLKAGQPLTITAQGMKALSVDASTAAQR